MRHSFILALGLGIAAVGTTVAAAPGPLDEVNAAGRQKSALSAPESIRIEHEGIHKALVSLTQAEGRVGTAAKELAAVLHPHFEREEEIALPPLGLLAPLAAGKSPAGMDEALVMSDTLRKEMPRMLKEHEAIRVATEKLLRTGRDEKNHDAEEFATELALHARTEEEVLYPAAILVGDLIRARRTRR
jgi:hypothetical protein